MKIWRIRREAEAERDLASERLDDARTVHEEAKGLAAKFREIESRNNFALAIERTLKGRSA